jgi:hypothetical protein
MTEELARLARRRAQMAENRKRCREYWATNWFGVPWDDGISDKSNAREGQQIRQDRNSGNQEPPCFRAYPPAEKQKTEGC